MRYREVGTSGIEASVIGLGTWAIGGDGFWDKETDDEEAIRTIHAAIDAGINLIDTAPGYGRGHSEEVVGKAIKGVPRDKVLISTKCGIVWEGKEGGYMHTLDGLDYYRNLEPGSMRREAESSMKRMGIDYIDVLFTHWQSLESFPTPIERTMGGLLEMREEGLIRAIGVSNCDLGQMKEYMSSGKIDVNQPPYSMLTRGIEGEFLDYCVEEKISVFAYSPLEQGLLTGRIGMDYEPPKGTYREGYLSSYKAENRRRVLDMLEGWADLTEKYGCGLSQLVIAWTIAQEGVTNALCGARRERHLAENIAAGDLIIEEGDLMRIRGDVESLVQE